MATIHNIVDAAYTQNPILGDTKMTVFIDATGKTIISNVSNPLDKSKRMVTNDDVKKMQFGRFQMGKANVGSQTNNVFNEDGSVRPRPK